MACRYNIYTARLQFVTGTPTSGIVTNLPVGSYTLPDAGGGQLSLALMVIEDSIEVYNEGSIMPREILDQMSYSVIYNDTQSVIEFYTGPDDPGLPGDNMIIVRLQYKTPV